MSNATPQAAPAPLVVGITGHRPDKLGGYAWNSIHAKVFTDLRNTFRTINPTGEGWYLITGMALGVDQWAAEIAIEMGIPFIAAVPFEGQESKWPDSAKRRYHQLLSAAFKVVVVTAGHYDPIKMHTRNRWIVDNCQKLVAVFDGSSGGTASCVRYAEQVHREIIRLNPTVTIMGGMPATPYQGGTRPIPVAREQHPPVVSETAAQIIERTRAGRQVAQVSNRTTALPSPRSDRPAPAGEPANPYRRVIDID